MLSFFSLEKPTTTTNLKMKPVVEQLVEPFHDIESVTEQRETIQTETTTTNFEMKPVVVEKLIEPFHNNDRREAIQIETIITNLEMKKPVAAEQIIHNIETIQTKLEEHVMELKSYDIGKHIFSII